MELRESYEGCEDCISSLLTGQKKEIQYAIGIFIARGYPKTQNCFSESCIPNNQSSF